MLRNDLARAGLPYQDEESLYFDFHSLRHRFGTESALAIVPPKVAQTLMRHTTITHTMDCYGRTKLYDTAVAVEKLPPLPSSDNPQPNADPTAINDPVGTHLAPRRDGR